MSSTTRNRRPKLIVALALFAALVFAAVGCGKDDEADSSTGGTTGATTAQGGAALATADTVKLGYFPNVTHAPAVVGVEKGFFEDALGETKFETATFNAGPAAVEALNAEAIDASFIGPNPAINAYAKSDGEAIRIVSGSTSGGAFLVVSPDINSSQDLKGKTLATPQLGNTQDVALRAWLAEEGLSADTSGGGDVSIAPQENADTLNAFKSGDIDGAWVPEPWATRLIQEGNGKVLVDESTLWPEGKFVTTHLIVRTDFLDKYPGTVKALLEGELASIAFIEANPEEAKTVTNAGIEAVTQKPLPQEVIDAAWENLTFTYDPVASSLKGSADDAVEAGLLDPVDLNGIYDLTLLNEVLTAQGKTPVEGL